MKNIIIYTAVAIISFSTPVLANDASPTIYVGVETGLDHVSIKDVGHANGLACGGIFGVQKQFGEGLVLGVEGEVLGATTRKSGGDVFLVGDYGEIKAGRDLSVSLHAGYLADRSLLLYVKGGYTNARFNGYYSIGEDGASGAANFNGYRLGTGFEAGSGKLRFRAEYRYSDYGNLRLSGINLGVSGHRQQVLGALIYGF